MLKALEEKLSAVDEEMRSLMSEIETAEDVDAIEERKNSITEKRAAILKEIEEAKAAEEEARAKALEASGKEIEIESGETKMTREELRNSREFIEAFANSIKNNDTKELRALMTENAESGTVPVPAVVADTVAHAWEEVGVLSGMARKMFFKGNLLVPSEKSATGATLHEEGTAAPAEEQLVIESIEIIPQTIKKWITITDELKAMESEEFLRYVYTEVAHQIVKAEEGIIVANLMNTTNTVTGTPEATTMLKAFAKLADEASEPIVIMNKAVYFNEFMSLADTSGRPIFNIISENGKPVHMLNGMRVVFNSLLPATATGNYAVVADMRGVVVNYPDGQEVKTITDPYSLAEKDLIKIVGKLYCGIGLTSDGYACKVVAG